MELEILIIYLFNNNLKCNNRTNKILIVQVFINFIKKFNLINLIFYRT